MRFPQMREIGEYRVIRVMLVDDHQVVRMGLRTLLGLDAGIQVVAEASNAGECFAQYEAVRPDVVLLDIRMRPLNGIEILERLKERYSEVRVLMLTTSDLQEDIWQSVSHGAAGYLLKDAEPEVIIRAVRTVAEGATAYPPEVRRYLDVRNARASLSARQLQVLELMARGRLNREIAEAMGIGEGTVKSYIKEIFAKMGVVCRAEAVAKGIAQGVIHLSAN
ncbi:MAG: response regulator transcription factor [Kiritimatiellia bacterium]|nr:response regulator transcription factor [Kiritimatiellia bacterium]